MQSPLQLERQSSKSNTNNSTRVNPVCKICNKSLYRTDRQIEFEGIVVHMQCVNHQLWHDNTDCTCESQNMTHYSVDDTLSLLTRISQVPEHVKQSNANMIREAARNNKVAILSQLLNILLHDHTTIDAVDQSGRTALMWAAQRGHLPCMLLLLQHNADMNLRNQFGYTALILACLRGHIKCVELLLKYGCDVTIRNDENKTALDCAVSEDIRILLLCHEMSKVHYNPSISPFSGSQSTFAPPPPQLSLYNTTSSLSLYSTASPSYNTAPQLYNTSSPLSYDNTTSPSYNTNLPPSYNNTTTNLPLYNTPLYESSDLSGDIVDQNNQFHFLG